MTYHCKSCDKFVRLETKDKHFRSKYRKFFEQLTVLRYFIEKPNINNPNEILEKYVDIHNKKYCFFDFICVVKVNDDQYIKQRPMTILDFKNFKIRCYFP